MKPFAEIELCKRQMKDAESIPIIHGIAEKHGVKVSLWTYYSVYMQYPPSDPGTKNRLPIKALSMVKSISTAGLFITIGTSTFIENNHNISIQILNLGAGSKLTIVCMRDVVSPRVWPGGWRKAVRVRSINRK